MLARNIGSVSRPFAKGVAALGLLAASASSSALEYSLKELPSVAGYDYVYASGLNDSGQVVGFGFNGRPAHTPTDLTQLGNGQAFVTGAQGEGLTAISPLAGDAWSRATGINNAGQVIGISGNGAFYEGQTQAFIVQPGGALAATIPGLNGLPSTAKAINASGQVVGEYESASGWQVYLGSADGSSVKTLPMQGPASTVQANGVSDDGRVVGSYSLSLLQTGFISGPQGEGVQDVTGFNAFVPTAINAAGQIVGHAPFGSIGTGMFREADGSVRRLDFGAVPAYDPGYSGASGQYGPISEVTPLAFNAAGQVGGMVVSYGMDSRAFISRPGGEDLIQLDLLSFVNETGVRDFHFTSVTGINAFGDFVANASNGKAYLISVVPEPATYMTMLGGLALLGVAVRRQRRQAC